MPDSSQKPVEILLLEDDPLDAELIISRLQRLGLSTNFQRASNRAEFESLLQESRFSLILADFALPDFDGLAALELAREKQPGVPFIFISGRVGEEVAIDTLQRGATDYVLKHRMERLVPAVHRALKEAREHAARMRVEALFHQSESRLQHVIDSVPQMIWLSDPDGELRYTNHTWQQFIGDEVTNCYAQEIVHPGDYASASQAWKHARERHEPVSLELRLRRRSDAQFRWHLVRVAPMLSAGKPALEEKLWLGSATDLQEQKLNEEALRTAEKLAVTGRMAAAIAHEINNPLESLTNLIFLVRVESEGNERALRFLDMTENELSRVSSITKQTLQFYRDPNMAVPIDVLSLMKEVLGLFATRLSAKGVQTHVEIPPGIVFEGIQGEIRQVLINLVGNAIDAVPVRGHIALESRRTTFRSEPAVEIRVCDNGSGFTSEQAEKLFQPFFSTKGAHGTGLGLWVSKGIVEKHGGELRLSMEHEPDGSARTAAILRLPLKGVPQVQNEAVKAPSAEA